MRIEIREAETTAAAIDHHGDVVHDDVGDSDLTASFRAAVERAVEGYSPRVWRYDVEPLVLKSRLYAFVKLREREVQG